MAKKIINGKMYNTETAKEIASYWNGCGGTDFGRVDETLYLKKTGEYFLYGKGGPYSKYRESNMGYWTWGEEFIPMSEEKAKEWCMENLEADEYIAIWGEVEE